MKCISAQLRPLQVVSLCGGLFSISMSAIAQDLLLEPGLNLLNISVSGEHNVSTLFEGYASRVY